MTFQERNVQPMTPAECVEAEKRNVPQESIVAINGLLAASGRQKQYRLELDLVVNAIVAQGVERSDVYNGNYLRFRALFEDFGWKVDYKDLSHSDSDSARMAYIFTPEPAAESR